MLVMSTASSLALRRACRRPATPQVRGGAVRWCSWGQPPFLQRQLERTQGVVGARFHRARGYPEHGGCLCDGQAAVVRLDEDGPVLRAQVGERLRDRPGLECAV